MAVRRPGQQAGRQPRRIGPRVIIMALSNNRPFRPKYWGDIASAIARYGIKTRLFDNAYLNIPSACKRSNCGNIARAARARWLKQAFTSGLSSPNVR